MPILSSVRIFVGLHSIVRCAMLIAYALRRKYMYEYVVNLEERHRWRLDDLFIVRSLRFKFVDNVGFRPNQGFIHITYLHIFLVANQNWVPFLKKLKKLFCYASTFWQWKSHPSTYCRSKDIYKKKYQKSSYFCNYWHTNF